MHNSDNRIVLFYVLLRHLFLRENIRRLAVDDHTRVLEGHLCSNIVLEEDEGEALREVEFRRLLYVCILFGERTGRPIERRIVSVRATRTASKMAEMAVTV